MRKSNKLRKPPNRLRGSISAEQPGLVAFLVVAILVVLLALVTTAFSRLMGREVTQVRDRELSSQAFYATESGLNDARNYLANGGDGFTGCDTSDARPANYFVPEGDISGGDMTARYSCVSINSGPKELVFSLKAGQSVTFKLDDASLGRIYFGWENQTYSGSPAALGPLGKLPQENGANALQPDQTGVLRTAVYGVPNNINSLGGDTFDLKLANQSRTYFMYPSAGDGGAGTKVYPNDNGAFIDGKCNTIRRIQTSDNPQASGRFCNAVISGLEGRGGSIYFVRLTALYQPLSLTVQTTNPGDNKALSIDGVQSVIDITGTGNDVLRRVQTRVDKDTQYSSPSYGLQSMQSICKLFRMPLITPDQYDNPVLDPEANKGDGACAEPGSGGSIIGSAINRPSPPSPTCVGGDYTLDPDDFRVYWSSNPDNLSKRLNVSPSLNDCGPFKVEVTTGDPFHACGIDTLQTNERAFIEGYSADNKLQFRTGVTDDIPECDKFVGPKTFGPYSFTEPVTYILFKHCSLYKEPDFDNSVCREINSGRYNTNSVHGGEIKFIPQ